MTSAGGSGGIKEQTETLRNTRRAIGYFLNYESHGKGVAIPPRLIQRARIRRLIECASFFFFIINTATKSRFNQTGTGEEGRRGGGGEEFQ